MILIEHPTKIKFNIDKHDIEGVVSGTIEDWKFVSDNDYFKKIVGGNELLKLKIHQHQFNLNELDVIISKEIRKILEG